MAKKPKEKMTALERTIHTREKALERMRSRAKWIMRRAEQEVADLNKRIQEREVILDALKSGRLKA